MILKWVSIDHKTVWKAEKHTDWVLLLKERPEKKARGGTSLVVPWLRICLPMPGTRVRALVREDPTCRGATKPVRHSY